jgi:prophage DNA circulation protein
MTDPYLQRLVQASWKGVVFSVRSEELPSGGRKTALHEFPNSDERFVEDLGEIPPRFTITAFVHGLDWLERAQALENALREAGPGRLVMPTFGAWTVWALPYSKSASQTAVGEIEFQLEFATSRAVAGIIEAVPTAETVFAAGDNARGAIGGAFGGIFGAPSDSLGFGAMLSDITSVTNETFSAVSTILNAQSLGEMTGAIRSLLGNAGGLLNDPINLALEFFGIDEDAPGLWQIISEGLDTITAVSSMLDFAKNFGNNFALIQSDLDSGAKVAPVTSSVPNSPVSGISLWPETTVDRIDRNEARTEIVESNRIAALVVAYEQAANADYQTIDQIQTTRTDLEDVYSFMMQVDAQEVGSIPANREVREAMAELRIRALAVLDQKSQSAWLTSQIIINGGLTAPTLTYLLYAESLTNDLDDRSWQIRQLNQDNNTMAMSGQLTVLRGGNA